MKQLVLGSGPSGTLLVTGDPENPVSVLIQNVDPLNTVYLGNDSAVNMSNPLENAPLAPGQSTVASGRINVFGIAAPGQNVAVAIYVGITSFFQPPSLASIGGAAVYVQTTAPVSTPANPIPVNSVWFNTSNGTIQTWNGSIWVINPLNANNMIQTASILAAQIANNAVTTAAIASGAVGTSQIASGAVGAAQVANASLTTAQLAAAAGILGTQIAAATITSGNIAANTIIAANIAANTITAAQLAAGIVYAGIVDGTTINGGTFLAGTTPNTQIQLTSSGGVGLFYYLLNAAGFTANPLIYAGTGTGGSGIFAQLNIGGAKRTGHTDQASLLFNSSDSVSSASLQFEYTDTSGNQDLIAFFDQTGFVGQFVKLLTAVQPGTSGTGLTAESWHAITCDSGWTAGVSGYRIPQYRILPDGNLQLSGIASYSSNITGTQSLNSSNPLPAAYRPGAEIMFRPLSVVGGRCAGQILSTGVIQAVASSTYPSGYLELDCVIRCP